MQHIATNVPVSQFVARLRPPKTAERIEVLFVVETVESPRNTAFDVGLVAPTVYGKGSDENVTFVP